MVRVAGLGLAVLGVLHLVLFIGTALPEVGGWMQLTLWTEEHWLPFREQSLAIHTSGAVFWSTVGSCAPPLIILGCLVNSLDRRGYPIPPFVGWSLFAWLLLAAAIIEISGFIIMAPLALLIAVGIKRRGAAAAASEEHSQSRSVANPY